jgi:hypothetical protein
MIGSEKFIGSGLSNWGDIAPPLHFTICGKLHYIFTDYVK